jgi:DNA-binding CsgD family transcriptional regulator
MLYQVLEGRVADLLPAATGFYEQLIASRDDLVRGLAALAVGATQLLRGTAESARRALTDAVHAFGTAQIADHLPWALALRCQAEALTGDAEAARRTQAASRSRRVRRGTARAHCDFVLADALTQLAAGDRTGAARTCVEGAAALPQLRLHAARLLHTAVRLGAPPGPLAARLAQIADLVQCPLPRLQAEHAAALAAHDAAALDEIAERFERLGLWLVAAESAAQASACHAAAGHKQAATRAAGRSADLAGRCEGARTPALALVAPAARLSRREREVAELAAAGLANAQIAQRLTLSTRTVESHLYQAYAKLGVAGRDDLAAALAAPP